MTTPVLTLMLEPPLLDLHNFAADSYLLHLFYLIFSERKKKHHTRNDQLLSSLLQEKHCFWRLTKSTLHEWRLPIKNWQHSGPKTQPLTLSPCFPLFFRFFSLCFSVVLSIFFVPLFSSVHYVVVLSLSFFCLVLFINVHWNLLAGCHELYNSF